LHGGNGQVKCVKMRGELLYQILAVHRRPHAARAACEKRLFQMSLKRPDLRRSRGLA
jgi:hypothetical protein